ncbi:hypothetical protein EV175_001790 [Coemansia sp. RSA 1933]|nr:hypothetical protein EV175_001790 [Coemansia sp. RSA 1933]
MRLLKTMGLALAATTLAGSCVATTEESSKQQTGELQQRDILDSLANLFNGSAKAGENSSDSTDSSDSTKSTSTKSTSSNSDDTSSQSSTSTDTTSSNTSTDSSDSSSPTSTDTTTSTSSPEPSSESSSSYVLVTVTRPNSVVTTSVARPTIDDANGDKANVGGSSNLTTIIVAPVVTSIALLFCAVMLFLYIRRKNRNKYSSEDVFAKGAGSNSGGRDNSMSPFIPQGHDSGDGYVKEEDNGLAYSTAAPTTTTAAVAPVAAYGARPGEYYVANNAATDNRMMTNPRYQQNSGGYAQQQQPPPASRYQTQPLQQQQQQQFGARPPILSTAPTAPPIPAPLGRYGGPQLTSYQQQQGAAGYGATTNSQYGNNGFRY